MRSAASKLASGSMLRVLTLGINILVGLFLTPFIIHSLGDKMYGLWVLLATFIGYYGLLDLGLSNAVSRHVSKAIGASDEEGCNRVFNTGFALFLAVGLAALFLTLVVSTFAPLFFHNHEDVSLFRTVILILGVHTAIDLPMRVFHGLLHAQLRFNLVAIVSIITTILRSGLLVFVLSSGYKLVGMAFVSLTVGLLSNGILFVFAWRCYPYLKFNYSYIGRNTARTLFSYSLFVFILRIAETLRFQTDAFVITGFIGLAAVAHYNIASFMISYFGSLMGQVMGVLTPYFSQLEGGDEREQSLKALFFTLRISVFISTFVGFGFVAWGHPFIQVWVGTDYLDAFPSLVVLASGVALASWQLPSVAYMFGNSQHKPLAIAGIIEGIANLVLSLLLVRPLGIVGVALGTTVPLLLNKLCFQPFYFCKVARIELADYYRKILMTGFSALGALILPVLISLNLAGPNYFSLFAAGGLSFFLYMLGIWFIGFNSKERKILSSVASDVLSWKKTVKVGCC